MLEGDGKQIRGIRLGEADDIDKPEVTAPIRQGIEPHQAALRAAPTLNTVVKTVVEKQRPRRPAAKP